MLCRCCVGTRIGTDQTYCRESARKEIKRQHETEGRHQLIEGGHAKEAQGYDNGELASEGYSPLRDRLPACERNKWKTCACCDQSGKRQEPGEFTENIMRARQIQCEYDLKAFILELSGT